MIFPNALKTTSTVLDVQGAPGWKAMPFLLYLQKMDRSGDAFIISSRRGQMIPLLQILEGHVKSQGKDLTKIRAPQNMTDPMTGPSGNFQEEKDLSQTPHNRTP